jgi:chromosomal replication initiator protein
VSLYSWLSTESRLIDYATLQRLEQKMDDSLGQGSGATTIKAIENAVAYFFGMRTDELHQNTNTRGVGVPRQIAMYLMKQMTEASVPQIGRYYGRKHSATVGRAIARLDEQRRKKGVVDLVIRQLEEQTALRLGRVRRGLTNNQRRLM